MAQSWTPIGSGSSKGEGVQVHPCNLTSKNLRHHTIAVINNVLNRYSKLSALCMIRVHRYLVNSDKTVQQ